MEQTLEPAQNDDELELDEMWAFVYKRKNKVWLWLALCRILTNPRNSLFDASPFWSLVVEAHQRQARFFGFGTVLEEVNVDSESEILSVYSTAMVSKSRNGNHAFGSLKSLRRDERPLTE